MQRSFCKQHFLIFSLGWIVFIFTAGQTLYSQNTQNPFDIKSRSLIDTTGKALETPQNKVISETRNTERDSQDTMSLDDKINQPPPGIAATVDSFADSPIQVIRDTIREEIKPPPSTKSENRINTSPNKGSGENNLADNLKNIKEDMTLSRQPVGSSSWWYYVYDLILLLILLGAFLYDKKIFQPLRKAFIHENFLRFLYRDTYLRKPGLFIYLNILFLLSLGFIIFRGAQFYGRASTFQDYLIIQSVIIFLFLVKHVSLHLLSGVVDKPFELKFYQYWMILSAGLIGLWMIPLALMISVLPFKFLSIALIITCVIVLSLLIFRQVKAMLHAKFFLSKHFFQYFLYFCAVEIIPALLLADILIHY